MKPARQGWLNGWATHDRRPIYEWAAEHVSLPNCYAITGPFHVEKSRYLIAPFDALLDDRVREVTIVKGLQTGGSLVGDIFQCWLISNRPTSYLLNFPTDESGDRWAERRLMPLFENCPSVACKFPKNRHKKKKNEILFGGMWMAVQGANETNLQSHSVPIVINEERWEWAPGMHIHARGRVTFFQWRSKILNISQAGTKGDDLDQDFCDGTMEEWEVPCPHCHYYQPLVWNFRKPDGTFAGMVWDSNETTKPEGVWNYDEVKKTARYRCIHCGCDILDTPTERRRLNDLGQYRVTNSKAPRELRSFHWNSLACDEISWGLLVSEYLNAKQQEKLGNRSKIREFWQKRMATPYDPALHSTFAVLPTIKIDPAAKKWSQQDFIFMPVDVQQGHFWVLVQAWSKAGEDCCLWFGKLATWEEVRAKQLEYAVPDNFVLVDYGEGRRQNEIFGECVRHGHLERTIRGDIWVGWTGLKGMDQTSFPFYVRSGRNKGQKLLLPYSWPPGTGDPCLGLHSDDPRFAEMRGKYCATILWSNPTVKDIAHKRREQMEQGRLSYVAPGDWNSEFSRQLHSEEPIQVVDQFGKPKWRWQRIIPANHGWDCYCMGNVAACMARIIWASPEE